MLKLCREENSGNVGKCDYAEICGEMRWKCGPYNPPPLGSDCGTVGRGPPTPFGG